MALSERLRYARERANLTGAQVEEKTGIGKSSVSDFENAGRQPSLSQLQALASLYRRSIAFFLSTDPIPKEVVLWREQPGESSKHVEAHFLRLCEQYRNLEMWAEEEVPASIPKPIGDAQSFSYAHAKKLAKQVRDDLQLGDRPALSLLSVLEEISGVKVFHLEFELSGTAACSKSDTFGAGVLLNSKDVRWRRNFDLAHELFHLCTWHIFRIPEHEGQTSSVASRAEESLANCFARNLLIPSEPLRTAVDPCTDHGNVSFEVLLVVARQFDVSIDALFWQLHYVYNWGQARAEETRKAIERAKCAASLFEERRTDTRPPVRPDRYRMLAIKALRHGEISLGRFAEYLSISRQEAARYIGQEVMDDEEVHISPA